MICNVFLVATPSFYLQMHIVHYAERFGNASTAMSEDKGLAVLGFLFEVVFFHTMAVGFVKNCHMYYSQC